MRWAAGSKEAAAPIVEALAKLEGQPDQLFVVDDLDGLERYQFRGSVVAVDRRESGVLFVVEDNGRGGTQARLRLWDMNVASVEKTQDGTFETHFSVP